LQLPNYTQVANLFIENMYQYTGAEVKVFCAISRKTIGWQKISDKISYSQLMKYTGLSINTMRCALDRLIKDKWITQTKTKNGYKYDLCISKTDIDRVSTISVIDIDRAKTISIIDTTKEITKEKKKDIYNTSVFVLNYLNEKTGHKYKPTPATLKFIQGRLKEKYTKEDCIAVIDYMIAKSKQDTFWKPHLTYQTLFRPANFPRYLDDANKKNRPIEKKPYKPTGLNDYELSMLNIGKEKRDV